MNPFYTLEMAHDFMMLFDDNRKLETIQIGQVAVATEHRFSREKFNNIQIMNCYECDATYIFMR